MAQCTWRAAESILTETLAGEAAREESSRAVMKGELRFPNRDDPPFKKRKKNDTW